MAEANLDDDQSIARELPLAGEEPGLFRKLAGGIGGFLLKAVGLGILNRMQDDITLDRGYDDYPESKNGKPMNW